MKFKKEFGSLESISAFVGLFAAERALDEDTVFALNFVIEEIFTNMVKYQPSSRNDISIDLTADRSSVTVRMVDYDVAYFDPTAAPPVDTGKPLAERRPGGLGIHLVKQFMDGVSYEYVGHDSVITLMKKLKDTHV